MWTMHSDFQHVVARCWERPLYASPMCILVGKLKRLKQTLKEWNKNTFGNLFHNLALAEDDVLIAQQGFDEPLKIYIT